MNPSQTINDITSSLPQVSFAERGHVLAAAEKLIAELKRTEAAAFRANVTEQVIRTLAESVKLDKLIAASLAAKDEMTSHDMGFYLSPAFKALEKAAEDTVHDCIVEFVGPDNTQTAKRFLESVHMTEMLITTCMLKEHCETNPDAMTRIEKYESQGVEKLEAAIVKFVSECK